MNPLRLVLRERTSTAHHRLDGMFSSLRLTERADYARFLAAQAAVLPSLEARLSDAGAASLIPDWNERLRAAALLGDLKALNHPEPNPPAEVGDWIDGRAAILGAAYVLEGSRLGGQMLARQVEQSPDPQVANAIAFLGHGAGKRFWPSFDALLGAVTLTETEVDAAVASAVRTFEAFEAAAIEVVPLPA